MELIPHLPFYVAAGGCLVTCAGYAALLTTERGQELTRLYTWIAVVVGVAIVLAWMATVSMDAALMALLFFVAGGLPMILRSAWLQHRQQHELIEYLRKRGE